MDLVYFFTVNKGLSIEDIQGQEDFSFGEIPRLNDAFIATIFCNPFIVTCSLFRTRLNACLKYSKSTCFCVISE